MKLLYRVVMAAYHLVISCAAGFNPKAKAWVDGRRHWQTQLLHWRQAQASDTRIVWMHCASLGEFEQGRPVLERIRQDYPNYKIVLTFYSPSGYQQQQHYVHADYVAYLPADTARNAQQWLSVLQPSLAIFVKYEFWVFHLQALFRQQVPSILIAASFRPDQVFFRWYGGLFKRLLQQFTYIFVQNASDQVLLQQLGITQVQVAGDPRVDRVLAIANADIQFPQIASFAAGHKVLVAGSTWPPDEAILLQDQTQWQADWKLLLAPHDIGEQHIAQIIQPIKLPYLRYSQLTEGVDVADCRILILDTIGMLSRVYHYGHLAYIGGGFGVNIHNTLEPAAHSLPVLFGPKHENFPEAVALRNSGGAFVLQQAADFAALFQQLQQSAAYQMAQGAILDYLENSRGASQLIMAKLEQLGILEAKN